MKLTNPLVYSKTLLAGLMFATLPTLASAAHAFPQNIEVEPRDNIETRENAEEPTGRAGSRHNIHENIHNRPSTTSDRDEVEGKIRNENTGCANCHTIEDDDDDSNSW